MEKFAVLTGNAEGQKKYHQIAEETKRYWNDTFTDKETGITKNADGRDVYKRQIYNAPHKDEEVKYLLYLAGVK